MEKGDKKKKKEEKKLMIKYVVALPNRGVKLEARKIGA
jgi:hypothetical protein